MSEYCEMWMELRGKNEFRVALFIPDGLDIPEGIDHISIEIPEEQRQLYVSKWFAGIVPAKKFMNTLEHFYNGLGVKFLSFREIRKPLEK
ncbi:MAG: hypothetical protein GF411_16235 [Candidatus Lokiarchaeota archaeon]|nr:hypothetical protein [Candidatus Lokiarchaeota archaeon]